jgi:uroporphyrinogen-III decarboxylase
MKKMNSRERVIKAVEFKGPDRVPNGCYWLPGAINRYDGELENLFLRYPKDFHQFIVSFSKSWLPYQEGINKDLWGCVWKNIKPGILGRLIEHPLSDWKNLESYRLPDPSELINFNETEKNIRLNEHERYILGDSENFFERLHWLRGYEKTLIDITTGSKEFKKLIDAMFNLKVNFIKRWLELDIDGLYFSDDWGTMQGLMINPKLWRAYFKPCYQKMFDIVHKAGKHVFFHSDGKVIDIISDFIEMGVDAINVQVNLIGIDKISKEFGGKICILADVDRQFILPFSTMDGVKNHIKHIIQSLAHFNGGLIAWGEIGPDVPLPNAEAMLQAFAEYGKYEKAQQHNFIK